MRSQRPRKDPRGDSTLSPAAAAAPAEGGSLPAGPSDGRLAYSVDEAARLTGLARDLLYDEMRRDHLDYLKVGRRRLITRWHLEQFLGITPPDQPAAHGSTDGDRQAAADAC